MNMTSFLPSDESDPDGYTYLSIRRWMSFAFMKRKIDENDSENLPQRSLSF
jgi:hypothetical protein